MWSVRLAGKALLVLNFAPLIARDKNPHHPLNDPKAVKCFIALHHGVKTAYVVKNLMLTAS